MTADPTFARQIQEFLFEEARLLDDRHFEDWMALFADDGIYWIPATPGQQDPLGEVSIAYEDRQLLDVRVRRLRHPENYADQPPVRTRRVVGNIMPVRQNDGSVIVASNFTLVEFQDERQRLFAGDYVHKLRPAGDSFEIAEKRVNLLNCDAPMGGIVVPF